MVDCDLVDVGQLIEFILKKRPSAICAGQQDSAALAAAAQGLRQRFGAITVWDQIGAQVIAGEGFRGRRPDRREF